MDNLSPNQENILFLTTLQDFIEQRKAEMPEKFIYHPVFEEGTRKIAAKSR
jgi:phosphoribosyl-ATP pyrophosphohydrolase